MERRQLLETALLDKLRFFVDPSRRAPFESVTLNGFSARETNRAKAGAIS